MGFKQFFNPAPDLQHHTYSLTYDGKLLTCPVDPSFKIHRLLDVGTGTGIWAMDYGKWSFEKFMYKHKMLKLLAADEHPETKVSSFLP